MFSDMKSKHLMDNLTSQSWTAHMNCHMLEIPVPSFEEIWALKPAERNKMNMFGKEIEVPRWHKTYEHSYKFRGMLDQADSETPQVFKNIMLQCQKKISPKLNGILVNWYNPQDYIGMHSDDEKGLNKDIPIVTITFIEDPNETRRFVMKNNKTGETHVYHLKDQDVFVMGGTCQDTHKHGLPKSTKYRYKRISVTIRAFL